MNRETKRMMAQQEGDRPSRDQRRRQVAQSPVRERTSPRQYVKEAAAELKLVTWPTRSEVINSTVVVLIGIVVMTLLIAAFDFGSSKFTLFLFN